MPTRAAKVLRWLVIVSVCCVAPASGADTPPPTIYIMSMLDGTVQLEGERYSQVAPLNAKLAEISLRNPKPELQIRFGEPGPCDGDTFRAATDLLAKTDMFKNTVLVVSRLCVGQGPVHPVPDALLLPSN